MIRLLVLLSVLCVAANGCPNIKTKQDWGGENPICDHLSTPVKYVIIHHTEGAFCDLPEECSEEVRKIQDDHMNNRGFCDIGYNFLIGEDGEVYEGRGWTTQGAHAKTYNSISIGISFIGNFTDRPPNDAALNVAKSLIACGVSQNYISSCYILKGHRDLYNTLCPGESLYRVIRGWPCFLA